MRQRGGLLEWISPITDKGESGNNRKKLGNNRMEWIIKLWFNSNNFIKQTLRFGIRNPLHEAR